MNIVTTIQKWFSVKKNLTSTVGFVPTMGNLHAGHVSLIRKARLQNNFVVVSIFINPTQFNNEKDFLTYPKTLEQDKNILIREGVDILFLPNADELYPDHYSIKITEDDISQTLEGAFRPNHFEGVLTILLKLFQMIRPDRAYFGEKDFQQLLLVKKMVQSFFFNLEIIHCKTIRAANLLALSSRNNKLTAPQLEHAAYFPKLLRSKLNTFDITGELTQLGFTVDYIAEQWERRLGAVHLDGVRLIDNFSIKEIQTC